MQDGTDAPAGQPDRPSGGEHAARELRYRAALAARLAGLEDLVARLEGRVQRLEIEQRP